jgi:hypothetical protein
MKQRDAVYAAVTTVLKDAGKQFEDGMNVLESITDSERDAVHAIIVQGFKAGKISLEQTESNKKKMASDSEMNKYVSGLISNWFRKDERLNGDTKYQIKNPGSRAGSSDPQLKALRQLYTQFKGTPKEAILKTQIEARSSALQAEKAKQVKVDISALPAELVAQLGLDKE